MDLQSPQFLKLLLIPAGFLAAGFILCFLFRALFRRMLSGMQNLGNALIDRFFRGLAEIDTHENEKPKSLPNLEGMVLPQVLRDYPDFDLAMAKNDVADHLKKIYGSRPEFQIHNVVLSEYRKSSHKRSLIFMAALCWKQEKILEKRMEISMEFQCVKNKTNPAINCPNCGATLGFGDLMCKYCGTRINDRRDQEWAFASVREI